MKKIRWFIFGFLSVVVSLYPIKYFFGPKNAGLLATKSTELLNDPFWNIGFYGHIVFGGIALLIGWIQFNKKLRVKYMEMHRTFGKIYVLSVFVSALCGIYIGLFATGGIVTSSGFVSLGNAWFITTLLAFIHIRKGKVKQHEDMMIYSYAACFAAVTLRVWLPLLLIIIDDFYLAYSIVAWLCWLPNMIVAHLIVKRKY